MLWLRGYRSVKPKLVSAAYNQASVQTTIKWIGIAETGFSEEVFGDGATATLDNTLGFGVLYLTETAMNRSLSRAVRNYLGINVVAKEEIGPDSPKPTPSRASGSTESSSSAAKPKQLLEENIKKMSLSFDKFKEIFIAKYVKNKDASKNVVLESDPTAWTKVDDISDNDVYTLLNIISSNSSK